MIPRMGHACPAAAARHRDGHLQASVAADAAVPPPIDRQARRVQPLHLLLASSGYYPSAHDNGDMLALTHKRLGS